jgi:hypothetical protein
MMNVRDEIEARFGDNLKRVRNLVDLYTAGSRKGKGRRTVHESDILRAAVVLLHATLEDFLRSLAEWKLPTGPAEVLAEIPLSGAGRGSRFGLHELAAYRGQTVDEVIVKSVRQHLERSSYNHPGDIEATLAVIGCKIKIDKLDRSELAAMMARRHWIAHRLDANPEKGSGHHRVKSLANSSVTVWIAAVERLGREVLSTF